MATQFRILKMLGEGGFGKVYLIEDTANPSVKRAMKVMKIRGMDEEELKLAKQEVELLRTLRHAHLLQYINCFEQDGEICLVTEYCPNGDLEEYITGLRDQGKRMEHARLLTWFQQIASAVEFLHSKNVIHRDLKAPNVFLDAHMDCKLGDLGIARVLDTAHSMAQTMVGTYHYMSPEIYFGIPYTAKTDIWSLGIVMYEMATLEKPFDAFTVQTLIYKITSGKKPPMPSGYGEEMRALLSSMLEKDPDNRPSAAQILKHKAFKAAPKPTPLESVRVDEEETGGFMMGNLMDALAMLLMTLNTMPTDSTVVEASDEERGGARGGVKGEEEEEQEEETMDIVERTLVSMGHVKGAKGAQNPAEKMKQKMEMLHVYCVEALGNDQALFDRASAQVDDIQGDEDMEEKLIDVLGHENFGLCGVQLLLFKNYQNNLAGV